MILYPAIDLKEGRCVRLHKGEMDSAKVYNESPADQAHAFAASGFSWLHVVDLDGAFAGRSENEKAIRDIVDAVDIPVQLGGGIRSIDHITRWVETGVSRVILGTAALKNPDLVYEACARFPGMIAVGIDARGGYVATEGWAETSKITAEALAEKFSEAGVNTLIYTDIDRDGTGKGLNMEATEKLAQSTDIPVIASGGVGALEDLVRVKLAAEKGVAGVIIGRAFYEGKIDPVAALALAAADQLPIGDRPGA